VLDELRSKRQTKKLLENREMYVKTVKNCGNMHKNAQTIGKSHEIFAIWGLSLRIDSHSFGSR
jgi:hypothetical protein